MKWLCCRSNCSPTNRAHHRSRPERPERRPVPDRRHVRGARPEPLDRKGIQVIAVVMRHDHDVHAGQIRERDPRRRQAGNRADPGREDGIDKDALPPEPQKERRVPDPRERSVPAPEEPPIRLAPRRHEGRPLPQSPAAPEPDRPPSNGGYRRARAGAASPDDRIGPSARAYAIRRGARCGSTRGFSSAKRYDREHARGPKPRRNEREAGAPGGKTRRARRF